MSVWPCCYFAKSSGLVFAWALEQWQMLGSKNFKCIEIWRKKVLLWNVEETMPDKAAEEFL